MSKNISVFIIGIGLLCMIKWTYALSGIEAEEDFQKNFNTSRKEKDYSVSLRLPAIVVRQVLKETQLECDIKKYSNMTKIVIPQNVTRIEPENIQFVKEGWFEVAECRADKGFRAFFAIKIPEGNLLERITNYVATVIPGRPAHKAVFHYQNEALYLNEHITANVRVYVGVHHSQHRLQDHIKIIHALDIGMY